MNTQPPGKVAGLLRLKTPIASLLLVLIFGIVSGLAAIGPAQAKTVQHAGEVLVDRSDLIEVLASGDIEEIRYTMNLVATQQDGEALLPFVQDLWDRRADRHPDLPWAVIDKDAVRIGLAHVLVLAEERGSPMGDRQAINAYAFGLVDSADAHIAMTAILVLGHIGKPESVPRIAETVKGGRTDLFLAAAIGLSVMCQPEARVALDEISTYAPDETMERFYEMVRSNYADANHRRCQ